MAERQEVVEVVFSGKANRPGMVGNRRILPGESRKVRRWQAEEARDRHPGLYSIVGDPEPESDGTLPADDLSEIRGITAETALKLNAAGITSFEGLAAADVGPTAKAAGKRHADVEKWQTQALTLLDAEDAAADEAGEDESEGETSASGESETGEQTEEQPGA